MRDERRAETVLWCIGGAAVLYLCVAAAPYFGEGLPGFLSRWREVSLLPSALRWCDRTVPLSLLGLAGYLLLGLLLRGSGRPTRPGAESGSAGWGDPAALCRKYEDRTGGGNRILTERVRMGTDDRVHKRNLNTLVVGGSGAGKTRGYVIPNILNCGGESLVVLDPKGELIGTTGRFLEEEIPFCLETVLKNDIIIIAFRIVFRDPFVTVAGDHP